MTCCLWYGKTQISQQETFKRIKAEQPGLSMIQIQQKVAAEWRAGKSGTNPTAGLEATLADLQL